MTVEVIELEAFMERNSTEVIVEEILDIADLDRKDVLEIGCGDGRITAMLTGRPKRLVAIDPDSDRIEKASNTVKDAVFMVGRGEDLDLPDNSFDYILFTLSLHHHQDCGRALSEATRVLKTDGEIIIIEPLPDGEVEKVYDIVSSELAEKIQAQNAINSSGLRLNFQKHFSASWTFKDADEVCTHLFDEFNLPNDHVLKQEIIAGLPDNGRTQPIELSDLMSIQSLSIR